MNPLQKDSRTLLNTPRSTIIRKVDPGEYYHFGLKNNLDLFLQSTGVVYPTLIEVFVGIDGLPISNSSKSQVWPILCFSKSNLNPIKSNAFIIGIYHGYEKPYCSNDFLKDFILEINVLITNGYKANESNIVVNIQLAEIICDAFVLSRLF